MKRRIGPVSMVLLVTAAAFAAHACGPTALTTASNPVASSLPSPSPPPTAPFESAPAPPAGVIVDLGLLEVLPAQIDGVTLQPDSSTAAEVASDLMLGESALSIAVALAVGPGSSGSEDLAIVSVVRLRPDVFDEAFYQGWRDTYDEAACEVADGVEGEAETEIGGRATYVGTCVGGAQTYHTYLEDQGFIVSIIATGSRRFGELILACVAPVLPCH